ncbi:MAG: hypothetical protein HY961_14890 [Ignavibacteriae bacterium]|nr:hypothetical protein [Ignavibacteriota bacterium]
MKPSRAFWGILFVTFGILLLANRIYDLEIDCEYIWKFWPAVFVLIGLSLVFKQQAVRMVLSSLAALIAAFFLYAIVSFSWLPWHGEILAEEDGGAAQVQEFTEPFTPEIATVDFTMDMAAGKFRVDTSSADLLHAKITSWISQFDLVRDGSGGNVSLHLNQRDDIHVRDWKSHRSMSTAQVTLHPKPEWDLAFDIGAASVEMDLSAVKVRDLNIDGGAANVQLRLGVPANMTSVRCDMGASKIRISVPESVGCEVRLDGDLSSKRLDDFTEYGDNIYRTENYNAAAKKIVIDAKTGLATIRVVRY